MSDRERVRENRDDGQWDEQPIDALIRHILDRYHGPLRVDLPALVELARQVERANANAPNLPEGLGNLLADVRVAVEGHLAKEEQILFPLFLSGRGQNAYMPVQVMIREHEDHADNLRRIRELTGNFKLPDHADETWRDLYGALARLEAELMDHIHLENDILFPRALTA